MAQRLGLDADEVEAALADRRFRGRVLADTAGGRLAGAQGTPTFFVDGEPFEGHWRQLAQIVPARLGRATH